MELGKKIIILRSRKGFTQTGLADAVGVTHKAAFDWEHGAHPRKAMRIKLAEVLGVDPDILSDDSKDLPEWEPPEKVKKTMQPEFVDYLKHIRKETEQAVVKEFGEEYGGGVLHSIDRSLKDIASSLSELLRRDKKEKGTK